MNDYKYVDFGNRLKDLREHSGFKQGQFADEIGITRMSMSNYESGKHCPDVIVLKRIAELLNCSVDYLIGLTDYRNYEKQQESITWSQEVEMKTKYYRTHSSNGNQLDEIMCYRHPENGLVAIHLGYEELYFTNKEVKSIIDNLKLCLRDGD